MNGYIKKSKHKKTKITTTMSFMVKYKQLFKKYMKYGKNLTTKSKTKTKTKEELY